MPIVYSAITRGPVILVSYQAGLGNYEDIALSLLRSISTNKTGKTTYTSDSYLYHLLIENGIVYLCVTDTTFNRIHTYSYLQEVKQRFLSGSLLARAQTASHYEFNRDFQQVLSSEMDRFSKNVPGDQISQLRTQVEEVKDVMTQNIDKILERGARLDELLDRTTEMETSASIFTRNAGRVRRKYWWKNTKMIAILVMLAIIIITIIILFATKVIPWNQ